jgi:hypothetical protein
MASNGRVSGDTAAASPSFTDRHTRFDAFKRTEGIPADTTKRPRREFHHADPLWDSAGRWSGFDPGYTFDADDEALEFASPSPSADDWCVEDLRGDRSEILGQLARRTGGAAAANTGTRAGGWNLFDKTKAAAPATRRLIGQAALAVFGECGSDRYLRGRGHRSPVLAVEVPHQHRVVQLRIPVGSTGFGKGRGFRL